MRRINLVLVIIFLTITSCKSVVLTSTSRKRIQDVNVNDIEKVQFYNSEKIILEYKTTSENEKFDRGNVKFKNGYYYYSITIPKKTPAIAKPLDDKRMKVYFDKGTDRYLIFGENSDREYQLFGRNEGIVLFVDYEGKSFRVTKGNRALLMIRNLNQDEIKKMNKKLKGVHIKTQ